MMCNGGRRDGGVGVLIMSMVIIMIIMPGDDGSMRFVSFLTKLAKAFWGAAAHAWLCNGYFLLFDLIVKYLQMIQQLLLIND